MATRNEIIEELTALLVKGERPTFSEYLAAKPDENLTLEIFYKAGLEAEKLAIEQWELTAPPQRITMSGFNELTPKARMDFLRRGGKLDDDPERPPVPDTIKSDNGTEILMTEFRKLSPGGRLAFIKGEQVAA